MFYAASYNFDFRFIKGNKKQTDVAFGQVRPQKVYIPKLARTLYVSDGKIVDNRWIISPNGVSYLTTSVVPGRVGNSVIYGHNTANILGGLWRVNTGDDIYVVMDNGQIYKYQVSERKEIDPSQVDILNESTDARLTIYTCSGFLDSARFVVISQLQSS